MDGRGFFIETYKQSDFDGNGISEHFVQDNWSHSVCGALRGLHYQRPPKSQAKLVSVLQGEIFDVAVDIRKGSPSYGRWLGVNLSASARKILYLPVGFAHGFCVVSEVADVLYKVTQEYDPDLEAGVAWNDPSLGIRWPIDKPLLSPKDARLPILCNADTPFRYGI